MSSLSLRFLSPSLPSSTSAWPSSTRLAATQAERPVELSRLEPRVEEREGYWVLKEKFREGINVQEKVKLQKEPMKFFMEQGLLQELVNIPLEELEKAKVTKDDIDVRLKWLGLFHKRKFQCKSYQQNMFLSYLLNCFVCLFLTFFPQLLYLTRNEVECVLCRMNSFVLFYSHECLVHGFDCLGFMN